MKYKAIINVPDPIPKKKEEHGWYVAKCTGNKYNRFLYVRSSKEVIVLSDDDDYVQLYTLVEAKKLYENWRAINNMKIEVS